MTKYAIIGLGYWGSNHLRALDKLRSDKLIEQLVVCDINETALQETLKFPNIEKCRDWRILLKDESLDMVSIVSPSPYHFEMTKEFLLAGKDVLVEKPMALTSKECDILLEVQNQTGKGLMVGHVFRFHPAVIELRNRIQNGQFGEILTIMIRRIALRPPRKDMGVMLALGIHEVDLTCFLLGDKTPDSIFADINYYYDKQEETALILQKFGKTSAYSFESWIDPTQGKLRELSLVGSLGSVMIDFLVPNEIKIIQSHLIVKELEKGKNFDIVDKGESIVKLEPKEPLLEEIRHFIIQSKGNKKYESNGTIGKRAVLMIEKAIKAYRKRRFVKMDNMVYE
ncbi:MAG: Gfo/Idh/MocA family oxidoreductase [Candidatus Lokiarchaeota archaeon]|nr:Gfo/Idh/MocA family oxidoreductase [Candidatus Lokiarchaeota archaeon]